MTRVVISNSFKVKYYQKNSNFKAQYNNLHFVIYARYRKSLYETPWWSNIRYKTQMQRYARCLLKLKLFSFCQHQSADRFICQFLILGQFSSFSWSGFELSILLCRV